MQAMPGSGTGHKRILGVLPAFAAAAYARRLKAAQKARMDGGLFGK